MEHYTFLRSMADSWGLLAMMLFFVGAIAILFRPGARAMHDDAASIPMRDETLDRPVSKAETAIDKDNGLELEDAK